MHNLQNYLLVKKKLSEEQWDKHWKYYLAKTHFGFELPDLTCS